MAIWEDVSPLLVLNSNQKQPVSSNYFLSLLFRKFLLQRAAKMLVAAELVSTDLVSVPSWNWWREEHLQTLDILLKRPDNAPILLLFL